MSETRKERAAPVEKASGQNTKVKKPYEKPARRSERIFETMALACGKLGPTQGNCRFNRKSS